MRCSKHLTTTGSKEKCKNVIFYAYIQILKITTFVGFFLRFSVFFITLAKVHIVVETFATAAYRTFPYNHPVFKLLYPHIKNVIGINTLVRGGLFQSTDANAEEGVFFGDFETFFPTHLFYFFKVRSKNLQIIDFPNFNG